MTTSRPISPQNGDVVIARVMQEGRACTLGTVPGAPQVLYSTYETALAAATAWALREHVPVWFTEDGATFTALEVAGGTRR
jgi:hypothetical protein